jgi:hypothetical protein
VRYLFQDVDGSTDYSADAAYPDVTVENIEVGTETAVEAPAVAGFTAQQVKQLKVTADGKTVVEVKYNRNQYTLTYDSDGGSYVAPKVYYFGASITNPENPTKLGFEFGGWDPEISTMPAADTTVTAVWTPAKTASYTVVYWGENVNGGNDYLYSVEGQGTVGSQITYSKSLDSSKAIDGLDYAGFSFGNADKATITADGKAVENVYFVRNTYKI